MWAAMRWMSCRATFTLACRSRFRRTVVEAKKTAAFQKFDVFCAEWSFEFRDDM
jgi:hypothetical protein